MPQTSDPWSSGGLGLLLWKLRGRARAIGYLTRIAAKWPPPSAEAFRHAQSITSLHQLVERRHFVGFNGQALRTAYLSWLFVACHCTSFLETGTYLGATTVTARWLFRAPTFTVEKGRAYWLARVLGLLTRTGGITWYHGDSRIELVRWLESPRVGARPMIYLDAHWGPDHPLRAEISLAVTRGSCVVVIDDCRVDQDQGFGYDSEPTNEGTVTISLESVRDLLPPGRVRAFAPNHRATEETGLRRGTLILLIDLDPDPADEKSALAASLYREVPT